MWLHVDLMNTWDSISVFDDNIGFREAFFHVACRFVGFTSDIIIDLVTKLCQFRIQLFKLGAVILILLFGQRFQFLRNHATLRTIFGSIIEQIRCIGLNRLQHILHNGQRFILDLDEVRSFLCDVWICRSNRAERFAKIPHFIFRENRSPSRDIVLCDNRLDAGQLLSLTCIDAKNLRMDLFTTENSGVEHPREIKICSVLCSARHLFQGINSRHSFSNNCML